MMITGLHHITLVSADAQRTLDFYTRILGMRLVKQTINFDDPGSYHLYFGDETGTPGTLITFFEWVNLPKGASGIGGTHHFAMSVADETGLLMWKRRLTDLGLRVFGPYDRHYFKSIYFRDPDGVNLEIATRGPGFTVDEAAGQLGQISLQPPEELMRRNRDEARIRGETWGEPVPEITPAMALESGMHHISAVSSDIARTDAFYAGFLELQRVKKTFNFDDNNMAHWYWGVENGRPGSLVTYFQRDPRRDPRVRMGAGQTHHFAFSVPDEDAQMEWRERLLIVGIPVSPVMDRVYFKSIYTRDPDGHIVELATAGPGFQVDEDLLNLGGRLSLPPWLEAHRASIEAGLKPLDAAQAVLA